MFSDFNPDFQKILNSIKIGMETSQGKCYTFSLIGVFCSHFINGTVFNKEDSNQHQKIPVLPISVLLFFSAMVYEQNR